MALSRTRAVARADGDRHKGQLLVSPLIQILHLINGARQANGLAVIIDVCRAFSIAAYVMAQGAKEIFPVSTVDEAKKLAQRYAGSLLIGEVGAKKIDGFDFGNSATEILNKDFSERSVVQRTSAGTQGIVNAKHADEILTGAFVNAGAIVRYIKKFSPPKVSLVCMGWEGAHRCEEDTLCAEYIRDIILGADVDFTRIVKRIESSETGEKFKDPNRPWMPESDLNLCLRLDAFNFVLRNEPTQGRPRLSRFEI
jgi:2-phosphosulfolactate phosphatase